MRNVFVAALLLSLLGCGGAGVQEVPTVFAFVRHPSSNAGSMAYETTKPSDPTFHFRNWYNLPAAPTENFEFALRDHALYTISFKHYDQEGGTGTVLQGVTRDADLTTANRVELAFQFN